MSGDVLLLGLLDLDVFTQRAMLAGGLAAVACGIVGTVVVVRRIVFVSGSIAHTAFGGIGLAQYLSAHAGMGAAGAGAGLAVGGEWGGGEVYALLGALVFALAGAAAIVLVRRRFAEREDTLIGIVWALGMAVGIYFATETPGVVAGPEAYLFGQLLLVRTLDIWLTAAVDLVLIVAVVTLFSPLRLSLFDEEFAAVRGLPTLLVELLVYAAIALTVVVLIRVVGIILAVALLTLPASTAGHLTRRLAPQMVVAVGVALVSILGGIGLATAFDKSVSALIAFVAVGLYLVVVGASAWRGRRQRRLAVRSAVALPAASRVLGAGLGEGIGEVDAR